MMKRIDETKLKRINKLALAFAIAFMPPIWAVLSPYVGIQTGAVALIAASMVAGVVYVGIGVDMFQRWLVRLITKGASTDSKQL